MAGLRLGVFAGSSAFDPGRYRAGADRLRDRGVTLVEAPGLHGRLGFLAGSDADRTAGLAALAADERLDGLIAARGGYGLTRLLGRLDPRRLGRRPVAGFSDVTALHLVLQSAGHRSIHGPVVTQLPSLPDEDLDRLLELLGGSPASPLPAAGPVLAAGRARAPLWGGNLALVTALLGTPHLRPRGPLILLLEDVGESTYRLDRLLTQLLDSALRPHLAGVALGAFVDCRPAQADHPSAEAVLAERLSELGVPVVAGFPIGHGDRNAAVPLGAEVTLDADGRRLSW